MHAQELLAAGVYDAEESLQRAASVLADAQVHATLAVASVLGLSADLGAADMQAWRAVAATRPLASERVLSEVFASPCQHRGANSRFISPVYDGMFELSRLPRRLVEVPPRALSAGSLTTEHCEAGAGRRLRQTVEVARRCVFCGGSPLTREHVIPRWLTDVLPEQERFRGQDQQVVLTPPKSAHSRFLLPHREMREPFNAMTVKAVCVTCNSGWMNEIERRARPYLTRLIKADDSQELEADAIEALATWVVKTTLMAQLTSAEGAAGMREVYHAFFATRTPPDNCVIWVAAHGAADWALRVELVSALIATESDSGVTPADPVNTISATLGLGHALFHVVLTARPSVSYPPLDEIHPGVLRLWPGVSAITLPPSVWLRGEIVWIISRSFAYWVSQN